jgi:hypothetical protein
MPRPKTQPVASEPLPPGPTRLEVRVNDKIVFLQRVYSYAIDQETDQFAVYGSLKPVDAPAETPDVEPVPVGDDAA